MGWVAGNRCYSGEYKACLLSIDDRDSNDVVCTVDDNDIHDMSMNATWSWQICRVSLSIMHEYSIICLGQRVKLTIMASTTRSKSSCFVPDNIISFSFSSPCSSNITSWISPTHTKTQFSFFALTKSTRASSLALSLYSNGHPQTLKTNLQIWYREALELCSKLLCLLLVFARSIEVGMSQLQANLDAS